MNSPANTVYVYDYDANVVHVKLSQAAGGRVTNAVGTIFRKIFVGTRARPI